MLGLHWFVRAAKWARHPPSAGRVKLVLAVIAIAVALFLVERYAGWPDWLTVNPPGRGALR